MILVTGPTGKVGQALLDALLAKGVAFKALARSVASAQSLEARGVAVVRGDLADLGPALKGIDTLFLLSSSADPYASEAPAVAAAQAAGVKRVVKLSALGAQADSINPFLRGHARVERLLEAGGLSWTSVRPSFFMQNWVLYNAPAIRAGQPVYANAGTAKLGWVDVRDIADVAVAALTEPGHEGRVYELTGPEPLSYGDVVAKLAKLLSGEVSYVPVPDEAAYQGMTGMGFPPDYAWALTTLNQLVRRGLADLSTQTVQLVTGHAPRNLDAFLAESKAAFQA
ncbi:MAG TPA: SDR family oxidoreductase [Holophagaceae bacterium]|nr:SDR family oxidoreductase [Holophagaceae bacterium]